MPDAGPLVQLLLARLERVSADSPLAHRASGVRGALLRSLDAERETGDDAKAELQRAVDAALDILRRAAAAVPSGTTSHH
ncbi:MAG TPA: hypothetical protein VFH29_06895 [Anaerolineales bacterium]|nr:hypothetical protein [Anaerolineales bacterium]